jgi:hypothetical protein
MGIDLFRDNCKSKTTLTNKEIRELANKLSDNRVYCKCGHSILFTGNVDRIFCDWCGNYCYKDKQTEFKYKMQSKLAK